MDINADRVDVVENSYSKESRPLLKEEVENGDGTVFSASMALAMSALGSGVLAFPKAYQESGVFLGLITNFVVVALLGVSLHVIARATVITNKRDYGEVANALLGRKLSLFVDIVMVVDIFMALVTYLIIIGDTVTKVLIALNVPEFLTSDYVVVSSVAVVFILPLLTLRRISFLGRAGSIGTVTCFYVVILVTVDGILKLDNWDEVNKFNVDPAYFKSLPIICFAYSCQCVAPSAFAEMKTKSIWEMDKVIIVALTLISVFYIPIGVFGYISFGSSTSSDILNSLSLDLAPQIARACFAVSVIFAYVLNHYVGRLSFASLLGRRSELTNSWYYGIAIFSLLSSLLVTLEVTKAVGEKSLGFVFDLTGATCEVCLIFVFPACFLWKIEKIEIEKMNNRRSVKSKFVAVSLLVFGGFIAVFGVSSTIYTFVRE